MKREQNSRAQGTGRTDDGGSSLRNRHDPAFERLHPDLPVFGAPLTGRSVIYVPGRIAVVSPSRYRLLRASWQERSTDSKVHDLARRIEQAAQAAARERILRQDTAFDPECLLVYLGNRCNGACAYCYVAADPAGQARDGAPVELRAVLAAARVVARSCVRKGAQRFRFVAHGGGEPTLYWRRLRTLVRETQSIADRAGLTWWGHIATNGLMSRERAAWLGDHFDSIGVSHDGPPDIHNRQRPVRDGSPSLSRVENTIRTLREHGANVCIRTTLLPAAVHRQADIVDALHQRLEAKTVRIEPVYRVDGRGRYGFDSDDAPAFVDGFLAAEKHAQHLGVRLSLSRLRMHEIHGPYCNVLRNVIHVVPGGVATACFFAADGPSARRHNKDIGYWERASDTFVLDRAKIDAHRRRAWRIPSTCRDCICAYHCTRGCPEVCPASKNELQTGDFHCRVTRLLAAERIRAAVEQPALGDGLDAC